MIPLPAPQRPSDIVNSNRPELTASRLVRGLARTFVLDLRELRQPQVDGAFEQMTVVGRTVESIRFFVAIVEYRLGRNGWLRAWLLLTLRLVLSIVIPLVGVLVIAAVVVPIAKGMAEATKYGRDAAENVLWTVVYLILTAALVAACLVAAKLAHRMRRK